ncbi:MAG: SufD family Fe-S cluster assembly protein [Parcubacteria group bacterium]|nr:SufD family Fe-S cluster assembly protein [Parcubacteria group bacterium]
MIEKISENLNEPAFIRKMRLEALKEAGHLPRHELRYGLGIFGSPSILSAGNVQSTDFETNAVRYEFTQTDGVQVIPWEEAMQNKRGLTSLEKYCTPESFPVLKNYYFAAALAGFTSGLVIVVNEDMKTSFSFESIIEKSGADFILVIAKTGSSLRIIDALRGETPLFARTMYVVAEEGASVEILSSQNLSHESALFLNKFSGIARGGKVSWLDAHFGGGFVKSDIEDFLLGEGAESEIRNITLAGNQNFDFYNASHHKAPHTTSRIFARGIAGGGGKVIYRGLVDIGEQCPGSRGTQAGKFLIASSGAEIDAIPSLDIRSREVSSSHALSISHLKDQDFFYSSLRGIPPYRAQAMLFEGFLSHEIGDDAILSLIRKKLSSTIYEII